MAKKGQPQSFQFEINTDEDLAKFINRKGLVLIDVYCEWCGPCVGMLNALKKIKLELGGDNLNLAVGKSDTVGKLARFRNKSEPTWLFIVNGRATNLLFGANVPLLLKIITKELELLGQDKVERKTYAIDELHPMEQEILNAKLLQEQENARIEQEAEDLKRKTYLDFCTNSVMENMPEMGITIFGPHINRDSMKKILEVADKERVQPKDRKLIVLEQSQTDVLNYACSNPIEPKVLDYMFGKELIVVMWKLAEGETRPIEEALHALREGITKSFPSEEDPEVMLPALYPPLEIKIIEEVEDTPEEVAGEEEVPPEEGSDSKEPEDNASEVEAARDEAEVESKAEPVDEAEAKETEEADKADEEKQEAAADEDQKEETEEQPTAEDESRKSSLKKDTITFKTIFIPTAWTPAERRTNACGIYVFFRQQTLAFLPPDPVPEPPHVVIIFDAYKKQEISEIMAKWESDVLSYGFFTAEDPDETQLVANSTKNYDALPERAPTDKMVVKISKKTSDCLLSFAKANPSYVSENSVIGEQEAKKFFPPEYRTGEQQEADEAAALKAASTKRKGKKKEQVEGAQPEGEGENNSPPAETPPA